MAETVNYRDLRKARTRAAIGAAALRLFAERGYAAVTLADVAEAAEVGQRTLFRYFADKEELLFAEDEAFRSALAAALASRPAEEPPAAALAAATAVVTETLAERRDELRERARVIRSVPSLQARERGKQAGFEDVIAAGLEARGTDAAGARLLARVGVACYDEAVARWLEDPDPHTPGLVKRTRANLGRVGRLLNGS